MNAPYCTVEVSSQEAMVELRLAMAARTTMLEDMLTTSGRWRQGEAMLAASRAALADLDRRACPA